MRPPYQKPVTKPNVKPVSDLAEINKFNDSIRKGETGRIPRYQLKKP